MKVKFSVIIPIKGQYVKQKFDDCELIYVDKFKKSKARNWGAKNASGNYLIHIDKDNEISPQILIKARQLIQKHGYKAIILEEYIQGNSIWQKARNLERKINQSNYPLSTPQIIERGLFFDIGGYDEHFNELDDWALYQRLNSQKFKLGHIKHATSVYEPTNVFEILKRRFKKGRELKYFRQVYPSTTQLSIIAVLASYIKNVELVLRNPIVGICLLVLKFFDWLGLWLGSLFPILPSIEMIYKNKYVADNFDDEQLSWYGRIKNAWEVYALSKLVQNDISILDLGCGTGRITKWLMNKNCIVTAADISKAMLQQYLKDKTLPKPILLNSSKLPFKSNAFNAVLSLRVIWHLKSKNTREIFFAEAARVTKNYVIMDFSLLGSGTDHTFTYKEIASLAKNNNLIIKRYFYLPLTRLLIKFEKKS